MKLTCENEKLMKKIIKDNEDYDRDFFEHHHRTLNGFYCPCKGCDYHCMYFDLKYKLRNYKGENKKIVNFQQNFLRHLFYKISRSPDKEHLNLLKMLFPKYYKQFLTKLLIKQKLILRTLI